ncbi:MAG: (2Fe-2S)-binding protein [Rhodospirillaceae bacterium]|jgi:carbon-monoxide dehydrogenase small subunit
MADEFINISMTVNGEKVSANVEARTHLVDFLRNSLELTGSHLGCEHGICGACSVRLDGVVVRGCLVLAVQCHGSEIETIEGLSDSGEIKDLQEQFVERNAMQCGFCTPGMLMTAAELLRKNEARSREEIRDFMSGNYCRCTGYHAIIDAIETTISNRQSGGCS